MKPLLVLLIVFFSTSVSSRAADDAFFENRIRPLLVKHCLKCHGAKKQEAGFRMDSHAMMLRGGDSGAAIIPKKPKESLLIEVVRYDGDIKMPPSGKLDDQEIASLVKWVEMGAPWPKDFRFESSGVKIRGGPITKQERAFWSFQPIQDPKPPAIDDKWVQSDIDRFILATMRNAKLQPVRAADKRTLIRRATFDLAGLPPTPDEVSRFLKDESPDAFRKLIDRLLESTAYGERWGRHWLDVVRYADTAGDTADYPVREAFRYRNWVINAFNDDQPYNAFIRDQLAGDIIAAQTKGISDKEYERLLTATGFIAISRRFGFDVENYHHLTIQDTIDTLGQTVLGLSLGCARCHDHKYDPVNTNDYYAWYGIFESTKYSFPGSEQKKRPYDLFPAIPSAKAEQIKKEYDSELAQLNERIKKLETEHKEMEAMLASLSGEDVGFEFQALNRPPAKPWTSHTAARITKDAQSSFKNVFATGTRGIAFPSNGENNHFGQKTGPFVTKTAELLHFNIDFRNTGQDPRGAGSYRFYLGRGPGHSAAMELAASAKKFYAKNGSQYQPIRNLKIGQWYNLQVTLNLKTKTYAGTIATSPKDITKFEGLAFTTGWDGTIDQFFVDKFGNLPGISPARQFDNFAVRTSSFLAVGKTAKDNATKVAFNPWESYLKSRLLTKYVPNSDGKPGFHTWRTPTSLPVIGVNTSDKTYKVPGTVPPKAVVVHPHEKDGVSIAWKSPIDGEVQVTGRVADAHDCGDSVTWFVDRLSQDGWQNLAHGAVDQNSQQSVDSKSLKQIPIKRGEFLQLAILPKTHYGCDLTRIELTISQVRAGKRQWDMAKDIVDDLHEGGQGNPHSDSFGHRDVWYFYQVPPDRGEKSDFDPRKFQTNDIAKSRTRIETVSEQLAKLKPKRDELQMTSPYRVLYGAMEGDGHDAQIRVRGERRRLGDKVPRKNLEILGNELLAANEKSSGRLQLANWMTRSENPLTARVMVNRIWQQHFGDGLVATENDFGARGQRPSHPQLLDWLATRFIESGWSVKAMHRLIMQSAAYQLSSDRNTVALEKDPDARLRWRFNRRRLSAEEIRDSLLFISGDLDSTMGGEHPFPPVNTWGFSQHAPYYGVYPTNRRSIYLMQQRLKRHPFLALFDGADPNVSTAKRTLTTVPIQALYLMNNEFVHDQSKSFARRLLSAEKADSERLKMAFNTIIGRDPDVEEANDATEFLDAYRQKLKQTDTERAVQQMLAWAGLVRTIFVRNAFLFVE